MLRKLFIFCYVFLDFKKKIYIYISANISEYRIFKSPNICIGIGLKNPFIGRALVNICQALMHLVL